LAGWKLMDAVNGVSAAKSRLHSRGSATGRRSTVLPSRFNEPTTLA